MDSSSNGHRTPAAVQNACCQPPRLAHLRSSSGSPHQKAGRGPQVRFMIDQGFTPRCGGGG
ncbi:mCG148300 [Mus musculus]|nr:mCG148300 [Mus musculus]